MENGPRRREKNITGAGKPVQKKGGGIGSGPVGRSEGYSGRPGTGGSTGGRTGLGSSDFGRTGSAQGSYPRAQVTRRSPSGGCLFKIIIAAVILFVVGGRLFGSLSEGDQTGVNQTSSIPSGYYTQSSPSTPKPTADTVKPAQFPSYGSSGISFNSLLSGSVGNVSTGWVKGSNVGVLDRSVDPSARGKRTQIKGNGTDTVTVMVYMCGTDLESRSGMATSDLQEMLSAKLSPNVNVLVCTGGCTQWRNNVISNQCNQIYRLKNGGLERLVSNAGSSSMTSPSTLTDFIRYCTENFPANRNELIFWDHGGGSLSGFGYDEKNTRSGSMTLKGINEALDAAGTTFDFIGFDACLMATLENALVLSPYADYMIASEETEPGIGWYYTNWLNALSGNTSMATLDIGRKIADDFVAACNSKCPGQKTTLSVTDLAELESTIPAAFRAFASDTAELLEGSEYKTVSDARSSAREFASSSKIDQVDLANLAYNIGTDEAGALAKAILGAVKYNCTSSNMTNAYGLSIYFPYQKASKVASAVNTYDAIGIDSEYSKCIQQFATLEAAGQTVSGSSGSPIPSLFGSMGSYGSYGNTGSYGGYSGSGSYGSQGSSASQDMIANLLISMLTGSTSYSAYGRSLDIDSAAEYLAENRFDSSALEWSYADGHYQMPISPEQWSLVQDLQLNVFFDDGEGFIDLGCDNVFDLTQDGALLGEYDGTWLAVNDQPVAYYYIDTVDDGSFYTITGRIPVLLNGSRADLIVIFDSDNQYGYIAGARSDYRNGETETIAKSTSQLSPGDEIVFLCDYYSYDGEYQDSYRISDPWIYNGEDVTISNVYIDASSASAVYLFTDIYCQNYWTPVIPSVG